MLSLLLQRLEPMLREAAGVAPWQVTPLHTHPLLACPHAVVHLLNLPLPSIHPQTAPSPACPDAVVQPPFITLPLNLLVLQAFTDPADLAGAYHESC